MLQLTYISHDLPAGQTHQRQDRWWPQSVQVMNATTDTHTHITWPTCGSGTPMAGQSMKTVEFSITLGFRSSPFLGMVGGTGNINWTSTSTRDIWHNQLRLSPWYNRTGWLGVKQQLTYLLTASSVLCLSFFAPAFCWCSSPSSAFHFSRRLKGLVWLLVFNAINLIRVTH